MSDFLDNLTDRLSEQPAGLLQPRLASRFEQAASLSREPVADGESSLEGVESQTLEFARILPTEAREFSEQRQVDSTSAEGGPRDLQAPEPGRVGPLLQPEAFPPRQASVPDASSDFANRLDAISHRVDQLSGFLPDRAVAASPEIQAVVIPTGDPARGEVESTIIESKTDHHHHDRTVEVASPPQFVDSPSPAPSDSPSIQVEQVVASERPEPDSRDDDLAPPIQPAFRADSLPVNVPQIPMAQERQTSSSVDQQTQAGVPKIVVESIAAARTVEKTVNVTIGRIDVRAVPKTEAPQTPIRRLANRSITPLEDYLQRRTGGRR